MAELVILPPGDPREELASVGRPESAAAQASNEMASAALTALAEPPQSTTLKGVEQQAADLVPVPDSSRAAILDAKPPFESVEAAIAVASRELEPVETPRPEMLKSVASPAQRLEAASPDEAKPRNSETPHETTKRKSAASRAQRGQAGSGGGQRNTTSQSIAAYASHVRSVLVSRTQRIKHMRGAGQVGLSFTIDAGGRLASYALKSSGDSDVDSAVRAILGGLSFPPPPNGKFSGAITITIR